MDGVHRICNVLILGLDTIGGVQLPLNPGPTNAWTGTNEHSLEHPHLRHRAADTSHTSMNVPDSEIRGIAPVSVRLLTSTDAQAYRSVRLLALHEQPPAFGSLPEDEPNLSETADRLAASDERCFFGAFQAEQLIGIIRLSRYSARNEKHRAYLAGLYVLPPFRRNGCGRALIREALARAANAPGIRRVNLTVVPQQEAAVRLYQSFGFRIYGTEQETFSSGGKFYDEHFMTLEFNSENDRNAWNAS